MLTTKGGLVFVGHNDGGLIAYNAKTGEQVWGFMTDAGVNAAPTVYEVDGKQYISVLVAGNSPAGTKHGDSPWTFALEGTIESETIPVTDNKNENTNDGAKTATTSVDDGNCLACHGRVGTGGHNWPDLQLHQVAKDPEKVMERIKNGGTTMPAFGDLLTEQQIKDVTAYITEVVAKDKTWKVLRNMNIRTTYSTGKWAKRT